MMGDQLTQEFCDQAEQLLQYSPGRDPEESDSESESSSESSGSSTQLETDIESGPTPSNGPSVKDFLKDDPNPGAMEVKAKKKKRKSKEKTPRTKTTTSRDPPAPPEGRSTSESSVESNGSADTSEDLSDEPGAGLGASTPAALGVEPMDSTAATSAASNPTASVADGFVPAPTGTAALSAGAAPSDPGSLEGAGLRPAKDTVDTQGLNRAFIPLDGLPPPTPQSLVTAKCETLPPFFSGKDSASVRVPVQTQSDEPGLGGSWSAELVKIHDRFGIALNSKTPMDVINHELSLGNIALTTKRMPFMDLRLSNDYEVTMPTTEERYKISVTYMTDLPPPACKVIAHESFGPFGLHGLNKVVKDSARLLRSAKAYYLDHLVQTRHPVSEKNVSVEDLYVSIVAVPWQGAMIKKFPDGIPLPCLNKLVCVGNAPLENGFFTLSLRCNVNSFKQYWSPTSLLASPITQQRRDSPARSKQGQSPSPVKDLPRHSRPDNGARSKDPAANVPRQDKRNRPDGSKDRPDDRGREKRDRRDKSDPPSKERKRSKSDSGKKKRKRSGRKSRKDGDPNPSPSTSKEVVYKQDKVVPNPPLPTPDDAHHPLSVRKDALAVTPTW